MKYLKLFYLFLILILLTQCNATKKFNAAKSTKQIDRITDFIVEHPKSKHLEEAKNILEQLQEDRDWSAAVSENNIKGFKYFKEKYPNSTHNELADSYIAQIEKDIAWSMAENINSIKDYEKFIEQFPQDIRSSLAQKKIEGLKEEQAWAATNKTDPKSLRAFLDSYPQNGHSAEARSIIRELEEVRPAWNKAIKTNTPYSYRKFIDQYPNSSYTKEVQQKLIDLELKAWKNSIQSNNPKKLDQFSKDFPDSDKIGLIDKTKIDWEVDQIFKGEHGLLPPMDKKSENSYSTDNQITVKNNTDFSLTIMYSGTQSKKIVLRPGSKNTFELDNGQYRIAANVSTNNVIPYAGNENLVGGSYEFVFYIMTQ